MCFSRKLCPAFSPPNENAFAVSSVFSEDGTQLPYANCCDEEDTCNHSSKPFLFPRLRNYLADFPHLLYSIDQRLLTLETWCGCGYEQMRNEKHVEFLLTIVDSPFPSNVDRVCHINSPLSTKSDSRNYRRQQKQTSFPRDIRWFLQVTLCYHSIHISAVEYWTQYLSQVTFSHIATVSPLFRIVQPMCNCCSHEILLPLRSSKFPDE